VYREGGGDGTKSKRKVKTCVDWRRASLKGTIIVNIIVQNLLLHKK